ncbi:MAG: sulfotransferase family protein [Acidimicrobiales bacterium]
MRLIGAGLPRTGTLSLRVALETIGFAPCYHMVEVLNDLDRAVPWAEALDGKANFEHIFSGYEATVDWPGAFFWEELLDAFPDAKVLLSVRSGESWAKSMENTIYGVLQGDSMMHDLSSARCRVDASWAGYIDLMTRMWQASGLLMRGEAVDAAALAAGMERYNDKVRGTVPSGRLLVWDIGDGFEPLCDFLEVPRPDAAFPHINVSQMFADRIIQAALEVLNEWNGKSKPAIS